MLLAILIPLGYLAMTLWMARRCYAKIRPSRVPLCGSPDGHCDYGYSSSVYRVDSKGHLTYSYAGTTCYGPKSQPRAVTESLIGGLCWPAALVVALFIVPVTAGHKDTDQETEAKLKIANAKLDELLKEQDNE